VDAELRDVAAVTRRRWLVRGLTVVVALVLGFLLLQVLSDINWSDVRDAISRLTAWQAVVLLMVVATRQVLTAVPLWLLVPGLGLRRALVNELSANVVATVSPAPSDLVLRIAMFRAWGVDAERGVTGLVMQSALFYLARLLAPVLGFALLFVALEETDPVHATAAVTSGVLALGLAVGLWLVTRSGESARWLGVLGARIARRVRPGWDAVSAWPERLVDFQGTVSGMLRGRAAAVEGTYLMVLATEAVLLVLALRFVGVPASDASLMLIAGALFVVYPLTGLPLLGLGVLDAALVSLIVASGGADPDAVVAGVIVWRVGVQLVPMAAGALTLASWRRHQ
jgi:Lysylphosphatidylglycerol synthase TM region